MSWSQNQIEDILTVYAELTHRSWGFVRVELFEMIFRDVALLES
jgi:hypothetical protein